MTSAGSDFFTISSLFVAFWVTLFLTFPSTSKALSFYHLWPLHKWFPVSHILLSLSWPGLPVISPAKMSLFGISRELQFGVYSQVKLHASPHRARKGELFHRQEKEVGKAGVNQESTAFHWLSCCQDRRGVFPGLCLLSQDMRAPPSGFLTI